MHNGGDGTARRGGAVQGHDHSERGRSGVNFSVRRVQAGRGEDGGRGDRAEAVRGEEERVDDWRGRLVSDARARESEGESGWRVGSGSSERERARGAGWRAREEAGRRWAERGGGRERGEREAAGMGWESAQPGGGGEGFFFFYFLFPFSISISFVSFPLEQLIN